VTIFLIADFIFSRASKLGRLKSGMEIASTKPKNGTIAGLFQFPSQERGLGCSIGQICEKTNAGSVYPG
jgi:hypothetical protein